MDEALVFIVSFCNAIKKQPKKKLLIHHFLTSNNYISHASVTYMRKSNINPHCSARIVDSLLGFVTVGVLRYPNFFTNQKYPPVANVCSWCIFMHPVHRPLDIKFILKYSTLPKHHRLLRNYMISYIIRVDEIFMSDCPDSLCLQNQFFPLSYDTPSNLSSNLLPQTFLFIVLSTIYLTIKSLDLKILCLRKVNNK